MKKIIKKNRFTESLELLLDIMCNTFGGVMFIALLLIVMTLTVKENNTIVEDIDRDLPVNITELETKIVELQYKKQQLIEIQQQLFAEAKKNKKIKKFLTEYLLYQKRVEELKLLQTNVALIEAKNLQHKLKIKKLSEDKLVKQNQIILNSQELEKIKYKEENITKKLADYKMVDTKKTVKLPVLRDTFRQPILLLYLDDKIYLISNIKGEALVSFSGLVPSAFNHNEFDFNFSSNLRYAQYSPKKGAGVRINNSAELRKLLRCYEKKSPQTQYFIWIRVHENCLEKFSRYFNVFSDEKWEMNWRTTNQKKNFRVMLSSKSYESY